MWWLVVYQDHPESRRCIYSKHRTQSNAEAAKQVASYDPYWGGYLLSVCQVSQLPKAHEKIEDFLLPQIRPTTAAPDQAGRCSYCDGYLDADMICLDCDQPDPGLAGAL